MIRIIRLCLKELAGLPKPCHNYAVALTLLQPNNFQHGRLPISYTLWLNPATSQATICLSPFLILHAAIRHPSGRRQHLEAQGSVPSISCSLFYPACIWYYVPHTKANAKCVPPVQRLLGGCCICKPSSCKIMRLTYFSKSRTVLVLCDMWPQVLSPSLRLVTPPTFSYTGSKESASSSWWTGTFLLAVRKQACSTKLKFKPLSVN